MSARHKEVARGARRRSRDRSTARRTAPHPRRDPRPTTSRTMVVRCGSSSSPTSPTARAPTDASRAHDQLRHAQKMEAIGQLAGGVAHDFNNILAICRATRPSSRRASTATDDRREDAPRFVAPRSVHRDHAPAPHGQSAQRRRTAVDVLDEIVTGFEPMLRRLLGETISLVTLQANLPTVIADPGQIEQVLMNLVVNARDAMPDGGRVAIETRPRVPRRAARVPDARRDRHRHRDGCRDAERGSSNRSSRPRRLATAPDSASRSSTASSRKRVASIAVYSECGHGRCSASTCPSPRPWCPTPPPRRRPRVLPPMPCSSSTTCPTCGP